MYPAFTSFLYRLFLVYAVSSFETNTSLQTVRSFNDPFAHAFGSSHAKMSHVPERTKWRMLDTVYV